MKVSVEIISVLWSVLARLLGKIIDFATLILLARLLQPEDFGLTAMALALVVIFETIFEVPAVAVLIRLNSIPKEALDTAFTISLFRGIFLTILSCSMSYPAAIFYEDGRIAPIVLVISIAPLARSLYSPAMVRYMKNFDFQKVFLAEVAGKVFGSILAIILVQYGLTYWALVLSSTATPIIITIISYFLAPYRPAISLKFYREFIQFISFFSLAQIFLALSWQSDRLFVGAFVDKGMLGNFTVANDMAMFPAQALVGPAMRPLMASLSKSTGCNDSLKTTFNRAVYLTMAIATPAALGLAAEADLIVHLTVGSKWSYASYFLSWLSVSAISTVFLQPISALCTVLNRPVFVFYMSIIEFLLKLLLVPTGLYLVSYYGLVYARIVTSTVLFLSGCLIVARLIGINIKSSVKKGASIVSASAVMFLAVKYLKTYMISIYVPPTFVLICTTLAGVIIYFLFLFLFGFRVRSIIDTHK